VARAERAALYIDMETYFDAAKRSMSQARRSIHFLNWAFEPDTFLHPRPGCTGDEDDRIANFLKDLATTRPELDVRILCWKSAMPVASTQHFFPLADRGAFVRSPVKFVLDGRLPVGACHHQKMIIVDDAVAFCGGGDIGPDRWDTASHLDDDPRREKTRWDNRRFDSRHEVMSVVDGAAAAALGELFRLRWLRCTGETLPTPPPTAPTAWPSETEPAFSNVAVGLSRTEAAWRDHPEVRECEALHVASIAAARRCIYMENQYLTSEVIAAALARRLAEPDGPEVILVSSAHSPSYFDQMTMDRTRSRFIETLRLADHHGRFQIYSPVTTLGRTIIVHAKLTIIDDRLVRVGSANLNNRSFGFDTECDLSLEADGPNASQSAAAIAALRTRLLAHWLGCADHVVSAAVTREGGAGRAIESLRNAGYCRLRPIRVQSLRPLAALVASLHIGDPVGSADSWRPWRRGRALDARLRQALGVGRERHDVDSAMSTPPAPPLTAAAGGSRPPAERGRRPLAKVGREAP
jgi:phosphatidylserine/phosphatidylglycerophosphate/cardiolipin synthase-like enzyme